jgi:hypothetical protein
MNVTAIGGADIPSSSSYLTAYPDGTSPPVASILLFKAKQIVSHLVTAAVGADGRVELANAFGHADVIVDVQGWYSVTGADRYTPARSTRIYDSRAGSGQVGAGLTLKAGSVATISLRGNVPVSSFAGTAAVLNVTVIGGPDVVPASYLTAYPGGAQRPLASNLIFGPRQAVANLVTVPIGTDGTINIYNAVGHADVIVDLEGWYGPNGADRFYPMAPARILDTRAGSDQPGANHTIAGGTSYSMSLDRVANLPPAGVDGVVMDVVAIGGADIPSLSFLALRPEGLTSAPGAADLLVGPLELSSNLANVSVGPYGRISVYNAAGHTDVIADSAGWFAA